MLRLNTNGIKYICNFNPIKAGGSESMYGLGEGVSRPPPTRKRP